jgi:hypothetical protein
LHIAVEIQLSKLWDKKMTEEKKPNLKEAEPRSMKHVEQEYANIAAQMGDLIFKAVMHLQRLAKEADGFRAEQAEKDLIERATVALAPSTIE